MPHGRLFGPNKIKSIPLTRVVTCWNKRIYKSLESLMIIPTKPIEFVSIVIMWRLKTALIKFGVAELSPLYAFPVPHSFLLASFHCSTTNAHACLHCHSCYPPSLTSTSTPGPLFEWFHIIKWFRSNWKYYVHVLYSRPVSE